MHSYSKRRDWAAIVDLLWQYEQSQLTQQEFCRQHGVPLGTFSNWRRRLREQSDGKTQLFVPVQIKSPASTNIWLEIVLPSGTVLRLPHGFEARTLREIVQILAC